MREKPNGREDEEGGERDHNRREEEREIITFTKKSMLSKMSTV